MASDQNLLFGILAVQMNFVARDELIQAMHAWVLDKKRTLADLLVERGALTGERRDLLNALVGEHLRAHQDDPQRSLAALPPAGDIVRYLQGFTDADLQGTLQRLQQSGAVKTVDFVERADGLRFRVLRPYAQGGLGEVFVAEDTELHREVALKEILARHADNPASRGRFVLEAEITGGLEHPGIVPVYGLGTYPDGRPFYAMRFIRGDTLKDAIERYYARPEAKSARAYSSVEFRQLLKRFQDVCNAVAYAHSRGVLHRDLKPGNIVLGRFGETLVVDWGLAKSVGRPDSAVEPSLSAGERTLHPTSGSSFVETQMGSAIGTPAFMSPEQAGGRLDELGPTSDVYSLGATLYVLLTGQLPFGGSTGDILRKVEAGEFPPPVQVRSRVPVQLNAIVLKAMSRLRQDRYPSATALAEDIEHFLADEPTTAYREPAYERVTRWGRRHRTLVASSLLVMLTAVIALSAGIGLINRERVQTESARQAAVEQEAEAEEARKQTRTALDTLSDDVVTRILGKQTRLGEEEKEFLRKVLVAYERLAHDADRRPVGQAARASGLIRVGNIRISFGDNAAGEADLRSACELLDAQVATGVDSPEMRQELAKGRQALASHLYHTGRYDEAESAYRASLVVWESLVQAAPDAPEHRRALARAKHDICNLLIETGRLKECEKHLSEAGRILDQLRLEIPGDQQNLRTRAIVHFSMSGLLKETGRIVLAEEEIHAALALERQLVADFPHLPEYRNHLSTTQNNLATLMHARGRTGEAIQLLRVSLLSRRKLAADYPTIPEYREDLSRAMGNLAQLVGAAGNHDEAETLRRDAHTIQKQLVADFPEQPDRELSLAGLESSIGIARLEEKRHDVAEKHFRNAVEICARLARQFPNVPKFPYFQASYLSNLTKAIKPSRQLREAESSERQAIQILTDLSRQYPRNSEYRQALANAHNGLASALWHARRNPEAIAAYRAGLAVNEQLVADFPELPECRECVGNAHFNLGLILQFSETPGDAVPSLRKAIAIFSKLHEEFPEERLYLERLGRTHNALGDFLVDSKQVDEGEKELQVAQTIRGRLVEAEPNSAVRRYDLSKTQLELARILKNREQYAAAKNLSGLAATQSQEALRLAPDVEDYQKQRRSTLDLQCDIHLKLGDHATAADYATRIAEIGKPTVNQLYDTACQLANCAGMARKDEKLRAAYADRAMGRLKLAATQGYKNAAHLRKDSDMDPLRDRADFKALLAELEAKAVFEWLWPTKP